jgi:predicted transcriptional regulator
MENIELKKLRNQLPHGSQKKIAEKANVHLNLVNRVLAGKSENIYVLTEIADYLTDIKAQKNEVINKLASLID